MAGKIFNIAALDVIRDRLRKAFQLIGILLFLGLLWWAGLDPWRKIVCGDRGAIFWAFFLQATATIFSAIRLRMIARSVSGGAQASLAHYYHVNIIARALGIVLPRSLSGVGGKALGLKAFGFSLSRAVWMVMVDNFFDIVVLGVVTLPGLLFFSGKLKPVGLTVLTIFMIFLLVGLIWWGMNGIRVNRILSGLKRIPGLSGKLQNVELLDGYLLPPPVASLAILGCTLLLNGSLALSYYFVGQAVAVDAGWLIYVVSFPFAQLSLIVALAPGGLGIFDLGWLGLLQLNGVAEKMALDFIVAQRAYITVFVLVLAIFSFMISFVQQKRGSDSNGDPPVTRVA